MHLADEQYVKRNSNNFTSFECLGLKVDASAFYPAIESYYGYGELPFLRVADVNSIIDFQSCTTIPEYICDLYPTLAKVFPGDIIFTKGGSVARIGLVSQKAAASRDLIFLNSSDLSEQEQIFLYLYFQTNFFNRLLLRSSSQTAQPHLTITLVRNLPVLITGSKQLQELCTRIVKESYNLRELSTEYKKNAEQLLVHHLELDNWQPPEPISYTKNATFVVASGRIDAEHFLPKFEALEAHINLKRNVVSLSSLLDIKQRGNQPEYAESGDIPVINSKHVQNGDVKLDEDNRKAILGKDILTIQPGDVLVNGTGVGTIGRAAPYLHQCIAVPDNHVTVLRPKVGSIDAVYLSVFLNSIVGRWQVEKWFRGSSGQIELYPEDIGNFQVWIAPDGIQSSIRCSIESAFNAKQKSIDLLNIAKQAIEIAIVESEASALQYLNTIKGVESDAKHIY